MQYLFGDCALDTDRRELRRGAALLSVEPQVFDLLAFLLEHRDRVVNKEELLEAVWNRRFVSISALNTRMNAARAAIGDSGEQQSLIRTIPRKGFRFVGEVRQQNEYAPDAEAEMLAAHRPAETTHSNAALSLPGRAKMPLYGVLALTLTTIAAVLFLPWLAPQKTVALETQNHVLNSVPQFESGKVPLVEDHVRRELEDYAGKPGAKAVAISGARWKAPIGWGVSYGAPDLEAAKKDALARCRARTTADCKLYAVGLDVFWPAHLVPDLAGGLATDPLDIPLSVDTLPATLVKRWAMETYLSRPGHKALAISRSDFWYVYGKSSPSEAARLASERCSYVAQYSCLLLAVDGQLTVRVPTLYRVSDLFLLANAQSMSPEDKQRIAQVYQGPQWRALAQGRSGAWYPAVELPSEAAAVEAALTECRKSEQECRVHAIGDFYVADDKS